MNISDPRIKEQLARAAAHNPVLLEYFEDWWKRELERLPNTLERTAVAQGRCQVLREVYELLKSAPSFSAKQEQPGYAHLKGAL